MKVINTKRMVSEAEMKRIAAKIDKILTDIYGKMEEMSQPMWDEDIKIEVPLELDHIPGFTSPYPKK